MAFDVSLERVGILGELWSFMRVRKKWWLSPIVFTLGALGLLVVGTNGSAVAPFIWEVKVELSKVAPSVALTYAKSTPAFLTDVQLIVG